MHARRLAITGRLAELALSLVEDAHTRALAAESDAERAAAIQEFDRLSRCARLSVALNDKLSRETEAERSARREAAEARRTAQVAERKVALREAVTRVVWNEYDRPDAEPLLEELEDLLFAAEMEEDFLAEPVATQLERLCRALDLPVAAASRDVAGSPTERAEPQPRQSSA